MILYHYVFRYSFIMKTNITYLILAVITTICISCESHNQPEVQDGSSILKATYTLTSTTTVKQSGTAPESSDDTYKQTAKAGQKKGQMTAGNSTRLELRGWDDYIIKEVELQMRSNKSSGAGSLSLVIGNDTLWQIDNQPFSDESWAGEYSTDWLPITRSMNTIVKENECIEINISATENSLYINSYTIYYAVPQCYTVTFHTGLDTCPPPLTQSAPDKPLILPAWQDTAEWYFLGWSEEEVLENQLTMPLLSAGDTYFPRKNTTLWSVYSNQRENSAISEYISGQYAIAMCNRVEGDDMVMDGYVQENGFISTQPVKLMRNHDGAYCIQSMLPEDVFYDVQFYKDSTVRIMHHDTKRMIGYKGDKLFTIDTLWQYRVLEEDGSLAIYYPYKDNYYALYMGTQENKDVALATRINIAGWGSYGSGLWLFPKLEVQITTWPFGKYDNITNIVRPVSADE